MQEIKKVEIAQKILSKNDLKARQMREIYAQDNLFVINIMSAPGSGKTTLLEAFGADKDFRFAVIEGDLETNRDAERLQKMGINAHQITTGEACHLEASMVEKAYFALKNSGALEKIDFLIIENVGNLVCPASYDLGEHLKIVLLSTPEGDDKVLKYPSMFLCADIVVVSKCDIADIFDFKIAQVKADLAQLNPKARIFSVSNKDETALDSLKNYIKSLKNAQDSANGGAKCV